MNTVQIFKSEASYYGGLSRHRWFIRLVSPNGQVLAHSEGYVTKWNAKRAAARNFPNTPIKVVTK